METGEPWKPPYIVEVLRKAMRTVKLWKPWKPQRRNNHHRGKAMETVENMALETILVLHGNSVRVRAVRVLLALQISTVVLCRCGRLPLLACTFLDHFFHDVCAFCQGLLLLFSWNIWNPCKPGKRGSQETMAKRDETAAFFLGTKHRKHGNQKPGRHHRNPPIPYSPFPHAPLPCLADLQARPTAQKEHAIQGLADQLPRKWH